MGTNEETREREKRVADIFFIYQVAERNSVQTKTRRAHVSERAIKEKRLVMKETGEGLVHLLFFILFS